MPRKKTKKPGNGYNKQPAMFVFTKDWLTNSKLKMAGMCAKGFWADFMFTTHTTKGEKDYGVFTYAKLDKEVKELLDVLLVQKGTQSVPEGTKILTEKIQTQEEFLSVASTIFGYRTEEICYVLPRLLYFEVAKINDYGLLYSSRMVRDSEISRIRAACGAKGGQTTQKKRLEKMPGAAATIENAPENFSENGNGQLHENNINNINNIEKKEGEIFADPFGAPKGANANTVFSYVLEDRGVGKETIEVFLPAFVYNFAIKDYETFSKLGKSVAEGVTKEDFQNWKDFVHMLAEPDNRMSALLQCGFIFPKDLKDLIKKGFRREHWFRVAEKLLSTGVRSDMHLYFRIPDALRWLKLDKPADESNDVTKSVIYLEMKEKMLKRQRETIDTAFQKGIIDEEAYKFYTHNPEEKFLEALKVEYKELQAAKMLKNTNGSASGAHDSTISG